MKKSRNILLIEPNYKNKYPPIGLMKIATYHKELGDKVTFYKGNLRDFILKQVYIKCINNLQNIEPKVNWNVQESLIISFIQKKDLSFFDNEYFLNSKNKPLIKDCLTYYRSYYLKGKYKQEPHWDRVCVTTLFTFHWKITIDTIEFAKNLVYNKNEVKVGGIMASLLADDIKKATGVAPITGLLDRPKILDNDNEIIVDEEPLDYSILDEIEYKYPANNAYFAHMTKGCTEKCTFCSVPIVEPIYKPKINIKKKLNNVKKRFGEQQNLLLMDNNILASPKFPEIINEIKAMGFYKGAYYTEPNQLEISIRNLKKNINDKAYIKRSFILIHNLLKRLRGRTAQKYYDCLIEYDLLNIQSATKEKLIAVYPYIAPIFEKHRSKVPKLRYVDFNQGTDSKFINEERMKLISEISISPLRIAFDQIKQKEQYINAVRLAAKYGIKKLSNYILYNYKDSPNDLYNRLKINVDLSKELNIHIYSFPMKYIPFRGEYSKNRDHIGPKWNRKFIRAIQSILNVTKGIVAPSRITEKGDFFKKAFGKNLKEFNEILYMPETYIIYRKVFEKELGYTYIWRELFRSLNGNDLKAAKLIIENNNFHDYHSMTDKSELLNLLKHYIIKRDDVKKKNMNIKELKKKYDYFINYENWRNLHSTNCSNNKEIVVNI